MHRETVAIESPLDALVLVIRRLSRYESEAGIDSDEFFARYLRGDLGDDVRTVDWANDYRHFLALRAHLDERLHEAA